MIDLFFRAFSRARWITVATNRGIYTGALDEAGREIVAPGFAVDEIGNVMVTPPVLDAEGNVTTPAVMDTWWCVNLRMYGDAEVRDDDAPFPGEAETDTQQWRFLRSKFARFVRENSTTVMVQGKRAYQFGASTNRIQLLDPRDIATPVRVWAGGMNF